MNMLLFCFEILTLVSSKYYGQHWWTSLKAKLQDLFPKSYQKGGKKSLPTGHTWDGTPAENPAAGMGEVVRCTTPLGESSPSTWSPELLGLGKGTKEGPTESAPLCSAREPEHEQLRPGKCTEPMAHFRQFLCRATWSLSSEDRESTHSVSGGKPSVA